MSGSIIFKKPEGSTGLSLSGNRPQRPRVHGTFPGHQFGEQVLSTGIPSLDGYIGGGIPLGSIAVIKDEYPSRYADLVLKTFLAEGATFKHHLFVASGLIDATKFADELPSVRREKESENRTRPNTSSQSDMKIAWRYKDAEPLPANLSSRGSIVKGQKLAKFQFTKKATVESLGGNHLVVSKVNVGDDLTPPSALLLLREITEQAKVFDLTSKELNNNLLRIGISHCGPQVLNPMFAFGLRAIVQATNSSAVIAISKLSSDPNCLSQLENLADIVIHLTAIVDDKKKDELGGVDGLCKIQKITSLNALKPFIPPTDLGFTFSHKRITFQELQLPPEGETTAQREGGHRTSHQPTTSSTISCGGSKNAAIDF